MNGSSFGINTITPGSYALNVNGTTLLNGAISAGGSVYCSGRIGIQNTASWEPLNIGDCGVLIVLSTLGNLMQLVHIEISKWA